MAKPTKKSAKRASGKTSRKSSTRERNDNARNNYRRDDYDNEKRGVLFKNKRKRKESQPDYTGNVTVDGIEYWLSAWMNESKNGMKFMSLSLQEKEEQEDDSRDRSRNKRGKSRRDDDDDLPF